jgi:hypothetical protein
MSVADAYGAAQAAQIEAMQRADEVAAAYRAVFTGQPQPEQQRTVLADLERFCGMRTNMMRDTFHDTAHAIGQFRVWQRIHAFLTPQAATTTGGPNATQDSAAAPTPGGGIAEPTLD